MFYGMSSEYAQDKHNGGMAKWSQVKEKSKDTLQRKCRDNNIGYIGGT